MLLLRSAMATLNSAALLCIACLADSPADATVVHPRVVRIIGNGNIRAGRRIPEKFIAQVRDGARDYVIEQPDGNHGIVRRAAR